MGSIDVAQRTVLQSLDKIVAEQPDSLYCIQPFSSDLSDGWKDITFKELANAIQNMALWIQNKVPSSNEPLTLAYLGYNDIRYAAFVFACMKLQHTVSL
jgi:acyl-CoA synthetase (AMP-forming)/AMP-acid ligase II